MGIFNAVLTILFLGAALWMGKKVLEQRSQITIACRYMNGYRIFILFCLAASVATMIIGFTDLFDAVRSLAMTTMVALFLCLREGAGENGFVYNGTMIPYSAVSHYDYKVEGKNLMVYVVFKEKTKDTVEEGSFSLKFNQSNLDAVKQLLEAHLHKKHKRMKKS